jgi:hypothetical protein
MPQWEDERITTCRTLQRKYHELREHFTMLRNRYYLIECAWCKRRIGWKRKLDSVPGDTSHGICSQCSADIFKKITKRRSAPH